MNIAHLAAAALIFAFLRQSALASDQKLEWDPSSLLVSSTESSPAVKFKAVGFNRFEKPVAIVSAKPSCGCMNVRFDAAPVAPGEQLVISGESKMPLKLSGAERSVAVLLDNGYSEVITLKVRVRNGLRADKRMVVWSNPDDFKPQEIKVSVPDDCRPYELKYDKSSIEISDAPGKDPGEHVLAITPLSPWKSGLQELQVIPANLDAGSALSIYLARSLVSK